VSADVPLPNDGEAMILNVAGSVPLQAGAWPGTAALFYDQIVPKPFCVDGPGEFLHIVCKALGSCVIEENFNGKPGIDFMGK